MTGNPSASVSIENDHALTGESVALANARSALWPLMGYVLRSQLAGVSGLLEPEGHKDRVRVEANDLALKLKKLRAFIETDMGGIGTKERGDIGGAGKLVVATVLAGLEMGAPDADALLDLSQVQTARLALIA